jgi:anti-sigma factor (TIGR02949 family)
VEAFDCDWAQRRLHVYIDSEMDREELRMMRSHIETCPDCLHEAEYNERLKLLLRRSCSETAPESLRDRIQTQLAVLRAGAAG